MNQHTAKQALQEADAARFVWWFNKEDAVRKGKFIPQYLRGLREGWALDEWRAAIDRAMQAEAEAEAKLKASIEACRSSGMNKQYLGDAVYVDISPYGELILTTEDGVSVTNTIVLEVEVWEALTEYLGRIKGEATKP